MVTVCGALLFPVCVDPSCISVVFGVSTAGSRVYTNVATPLPEFVVCAGVCWSAAAARSHARRLEEFRWLERRPMVEDSDADHSTRDPASSRGAWKTGSHFGVRECHDGMPELNPALATISRERASSEYGDNRRGVTADQRCARA